MELHRIYFPEVRIGFLSDFFSEGSERIFIGFLSDFYRIYFRIYFPGFLSDFYRIFILWNKTLVSLSKMSYDFHEV